VRLLLGRGWRFGKGRSRGFRRPVPNEFRARLAHFDLDMEVNGLPMQSPTSDLLSHKQPALVVLKIEKYYLKSGIKLPPKTIVSPTGSI